MINGMYLSTMGAMVQVARHGSTANNLANTSTPGFKPDWTLYRAIPAESVLLDGNRAEIDRILQETGGGVWLERTVSDFTAGSYRATGNPLDLAIDDSKADPGRTGFFMVRSADLAGDVYYTRDGHFMVNADGSLVNARGDHVLDTGGNPITIPAQATEVRVAEDGRIYNAADSAEIAQIGVVRTADPTKMRKIGDNLFRREDAELQNDQRGIQEGTIEESAANPIYEMVSMIEGYRTYEANMRFIQIQDETLGDTVRRVGAVA